LCHYQNIKGPLWDEDDDVLTNPLLMVLCWQEGDKYVYIYDKYDVWRCDPEWKEAVVNFTNGSSRKIRSLTGTSL
jgi:hypothetical protein